MILILYATALLLIAALTIGAPFVRGGETLFQQPEDRLAAVWIGLSVLLSATAVMGLFTALQPYGPLLPAALSILCLLHRRARLALTQLYHSVADAGMLRQLLFCALGILVAYFGAGYVTWYNTGNFEYPLIQWLANEGVTPGLALAYPRYGMVSASFFLSALFERGPLLARGTTIVFSLLLLLSLLSSWLAAARLFRGQFRASDGFGFAGFGIAALYMIAQGPSPNPEALVTPVIVAVFWLLLRSSDQGAEAFDVFRCRTAAVFAGVAAFSIHWIGLFAALIALVSFFRQSGGGYRKWPHFAVALLALLPHLAANAVISGCPAFPLPFCFDTAWALPRPQASANFASYWLWNGWEPVLPPPPRAGFPDTIAMFLIRAFKERGLMLVVIFAAPLAVLLAAFFNRLGRAAYTKTAILAFILALASLLLVPQIRIIAGYWIALWAAALGAAIYYAVGREPLLRPASLMPAPWQKRANQALLAVCCLCLWLVMTHAETADLAGSPLRTALRDGRLPAKIVGREYGMFLPPRLVDHRVIWDPATNLLQASPLAFQEESKGGFRFLRPAAGDQCWTAPQPCLPYGLPDGIRADGKGFARSR